MPKQASFDQVLYDHQCRVVSQRNCGNRLFVLTLESITADFICSPGQFVMLDLPDNRFFFRRPFSVLNVLPPRRFELLYKVVGQGTEMMEHFELGQLLNVLAPLGKSFPAPESLRENDNVLLLGGGIGIAPLYAWLKSRPNKELNITCAYGVRSADELAIREELSECLSSQNRIFATDDGSYKASDGFSGRIHHWLEQNPDRAEQATIALICGPMPMMRACAETLQRLNPGLPVYISLENHMPCGTGVCSGCVVFTNDSLPVKVCLEGPVLPASRIDWANADGRQDFVLNAACAAPSAKPDAYTSPLEKQAEISPCPQ